MAAVESRAILQVKSFMKRYGPAHLELAVHAAVPMVLTPELLHLLHLNFTPHLPWYAQADLLLSPLCQETVAGYYEIEADIRDYLLDELKTAPQFGPARPKAVAAFLEAYASREMRLGFGDPNLPTEFYESLRWVARAYLNPAETARELVSAMSRATQESDKAALIRLSGVTNNLKAPLGGQENLAVYATGMIYLVEHNNEAAYRYFELVSHDSSPTVAGHPAPGFVELSAVLQPDFADLPLDLSRFSDEISLQAEIEELQNRLATTVSLREKLRWQRELAQLQAELQRRHFEQNTVPNRADAPPQTMVRCTLSTSRLEIGAGQSDELGVTLVNLTDRVERFELDITDLPAEWVQLESNSLLLYPDAPSNEGNYSITFNIPVGTPPGTYTPGLTISTTDQIALYTQTITLSIQEQPANEQTTNKQGPAPAYQTAGVQPGSGESLLSPSLRWLLPEKTFGSLTGLTFKEIDSDLANPTLSSLAFQFTVVNNSSTIDFYTVTLEGAEPQLDVQITPQTFSLRPSNNKLQEQEDDESSQLVRVEIKPALKAIPGEYKLGLRVEARSGPIGSVHLSEALLIELTPRPGYNEHYTNLAEVEKEIFERHLAEQQRLLQEAVLSDLLKFDTNARPLLVQNNLIEIEYEPYVVIEPGGGFTAKVKLRNLGSLPDDFQINPNGLYAGWLSFDHFKINLFPYWSEALQLKVTVPPGTPAGYYYPTFRVYPALEPRNGVEVVLIVQVIELPVLTLEGAKKNLKKLIERREELVAELTKPDLRITGIEAGPVASSGTDLRIKITYAVSNRKANFETSRVSAELVNPIADLRTGVAILSVSKEISTTSARVTSAINNHQAEWLLSATDRRNGLRGTYQLEMVVTKKQGDIIVVRTVCEGQGRRHREGFFDLGSRDYKIEYQSPQIIVI